MSVTVNSVVRLNATQVQLNVTEMTQGWGYTAVASNVKDVGGNVIDPAHDSAGFSGVGAGPQVASVTFIDTTHIDVTFNENMRDDAILITAGNYIMTGPDTPAVVAVVRQDAVTVRLEINFSVSGDYTVTVSNVTDLVGNVVDPAHDTGIVTVNLATNWTERATGAVTKPSARVFGTMAYDSGRGVVVLFGGTVGGVRVQETWEWDGTTWAQKLPAHKPSARYYHSLAYDSARGVCVMFGGDDGGWKNDTWEWDGTDWTEKFPASSPTAGGENYSAYDSARGVVVIVGHAWMFTWEYDGTTWTQRLPAHNPPYRRFFNLAYDSSRGVSVLFGGQTVQDTWEWNGTDWTQILPANKPSARYFHAMDFDSQTNKVVLFGGNDGAVDDETWEYNGVNWTQVAPASKPSARNKMYMAFDSVRRKTVLFGGETGSGDSQETWEYF